MTQTSSVMKWNICEKKIIPKIYNSNVSGKPKKNIQIMPDYEPKSTNHFILPKKSSSNIKPLSSNQITTSNSLDVLSENTENSLDANNVTSIGDNDAESFPY